MFYKTKELNFQTDGVGISDLCYYNEFYYLNSPHEIPECEEVSEDEFAEVLNSIVRCTGGYEEGTEEPTDQKKEEGPIIDPQTGEEVKKPDLSGDPSIDQSTGMLKDLTQDDAYPSEILENIQPSKEETEF